jgi:hypothetical protein
MSNTENALVAVSNGESVIPAKKFRVCLNDNFGDERMVLANNVMFKDGLVLLEGIKYIVSVGSSIPAIYHIDCGGKWKTISNRQICWRITICSSGSSSVDHVQYTVESASAILDRKSVRLVEGLISTEYLDPKWFQSKDQALMQVNTKQAANNDEVRRKNSAKIQYMAEQHRQARAYTAWCDTPWYKKIFTSFNKFQQQYQLDQMLDTLWVVDEASKLGIEFAKQDDLAHLSDTLAEQLKA